MNIDLNSNNEYTHEYLNILSQSGFISLINGVTRPSMNGGSCIDHIFLKSSKTNVECTLIILENDITDHHTVINTLNMGKKSSKTPKPLNIKKTNIKMLRNLLGESKVENTINTMDPNTTTKIFIENLNHYFRAKDRKRKEWITTGLVQAIHHRQYLYKDMRKNPGDPTKKLIYTSYCNQLNSLVKETK